MPIEKNLAKQLRALRKDRGFTQEGLAEKAGLEYKYIQMLEGKTPPSATLRTLSKLAKAFELEVWELVHFPATRRKSK